MDQSTCISVSQSSVLVTWIRPEATDNAGIIPTLNCNIESGSDFEIGSTEVICHALDSAGNQATCKFTVQVEGNDK